MLKNRVKRTFFIGALCLLASAGSVAGTSERSSGGAINCDPAEMAAMDDKTRSRAEKICARKEKSAAKDKESADKKKAWYDKHVKGRKAMEDVVKANKGRHPADVEDLGDQIIWTYRSKSSHALLSECKEYTFGEAGKSLSNRRTYACE